VRLFRARPEWIRPLSPPAIDRLESVQVPVLVLLGERDPTESNEAGRVLLDRVKDAVGETLPGCGHLVPVECARGTLGAIRKSMPSRDSRAEHPRVAHITGPAAI
jgi:pimeloyl-ACP methyl ester carboxylesterase